jgi:hypothetical protein
VCWPLYRHENDQLYWPEKPIVMVTFVGPYRPIITVMCMWAPIQP